MRIGQCSKSSQHHHLGHQHHHLYHLDSLGKEEVFRQVAAEGLKAALVVQQLLSHQGGHARGAVDPEEVAEENNEDDHGGVDYLFRYMRAWKVPKNTFSRDEEAPAPSQVSGVLYN